MDQHDQNIQTADQRADIKKQAGIKIKQIHEESDQYRCSCRKQLYDLAVCQKILIQPHFILPDQGRAAQGAALPLQYYSLFS